MPRHFLPLDGLRGIAILLVILVHAFRYHGDSQIGTILVSIAKSGWMGVQLFFVLSGFLISGILLDTKGKPHAYRDFYMRRTLRIFPVFFVFLAIYFFLVPLIPYAAQRLVQPPSETKIYYWIYLVNFKEFLTGYYNETPPIQHLWSLAVEEQVYLIWPLILFLLPNRRLPIFFFATVLGAFAWRFFTRYFHLELEMTVAWPIGNLELFAWGGLVAWLLRSKVELLQRWSGWIASISGLFLLAMFVMLGHFNYFLSPVLILTIGMTGLGIFFSSLVGYLITRPESNWLNRLLCFSWLRSTGKYSYAIYLVHFPIVFLLVDQISGALGPRIGLVGLVFVISYALAWVSWRLIESPFLKLKKYFPTQGGSVNRGG